jgi:hypothetical protein
LLVYTFAASYSDSNLLLLGLELSYRPQRAVLSGPLKSSTKSRVQPVRLLGAASAVAAGAPTIESTNPITVPARATTDGSARR